MEVSKLFSAQETNLSTSEFEETFHINFTNSILPILDNLSQLYLPFQSLEIISIIFCILQFFETSFWPEYGNYFENTTNILHYVSFFTSFIPNSEQNIILFFVFFLLIFIIFSIFSILLIHYHKSRRIYQPLLYILRIYFMFFGPVVLHPIAALAGHIFNEIIDKKKTVDIIMLFFISITFILAEILFYIFQRFVNEGIYLHKSLFNTFDSKLLVFLFVWNPLFLFLSHLFKYYPSWSFYFLIFFHIFLILTLFASYIWMPYIINFGNALIISILISMIFIDIFRIIVEFFPMKIEIFITICYIAFIIITIITCLVIDFFRNRIHKKLSYSVFPNKIEDNIEITNDEKVEYFLELNLHQDIKKTFIYLIVGFTSGSDLFSDFSLVQFCFDYYINSPTMIVLLIHLLSYFQSEEILYDRLLKQIHFLRDQTFYDKFIYFQAHRIKLFRQFTPTNNSSSRLNELKLLTNDLEGQIKSFWTLKEASKNLLYQLELKQRNLNNFWIESLEYNYLSVSFHEEYIRFLIESCTNFQRAVQIESIKEKLSSFKGERNDLCFLSLILCFPKYLSNKAFNKEAKQITKKTSKTHLEQSSNSSYNEKYSTSSSECDFTQDEQIANSILTYGRLRLSMQNTLSYCKPTIGKILLLYTVFLILISLVCLIAFFSIYMNFFDNFNNWDEEVGVLIKLRLSYVRSFFCLSVFFGQKNNKFDISPIDCEFMNEQNRNFLELKSEFNRLAENYIKEIETEFSNLIEVLLELALTRVDTTALTSILFDQNIKANVCYHGEIIDQINWSMEQILNFDVVSFLALSNQSETDVSKWYNNTYWCHISTNFPDVTNTFIVIQNSLFTDLYNSSIETSKDIVLQMYIIGPCLFLIFIIPLPIILYFYSNEIDHLIKMILTTDDEYKEQARNNISLIHLTEIEHSIPPITKSSFSFKFILFSIISMISVLSFIIFLLLILYNAKLISDRLRNFGIWSCNFSLLRAFLMELIIELINAVYYDDLDFSYNSIDAYKKRIYKIFSSFELLIYNIMNDTPRNPAAVGVDHIIDEIVLMSHCENSDKFTSLHESYKCGSLNNYVATIHSLSRKICEELESFNGQFKGEVLANVYHLIFAHAISDLINISDRYESLQNEEIKQYKTNLAVFFVCGLVFIIIFSSFLMFINVDFRRIFYMSICLIRRLSPAGFINNGELTNYLIYKKGEEVETGVTHAIFNNCFDGIICLNNDGVVEIINKSFTNDFGYSTEQLVGQNVGIIFDNDSCVKVENQLKLMKNHESRDYVDNVICLSNDGRRIQTHITLFMIKEIESSFILVVRDDTILLEKKERAEMAKKQSQDLLEQIMPPKVILMMKEGKSEISFSIPSATVLFIDIVNFSGFSASLSPQQIMGTLSTLFGAFDVWIQKFPMMTKIKLIGDIYMAACGLFANDVEPKLHAKQAIEFSLLVMDILDDSNLKLNMSLQIRIGLNSDGPLIAGVLGTENRVFDIMGDTINVASRLEHKAEPGHILMSEKTFDLVNEFNFNIRYVGELLLKGKGYMKAFTI